MTHNALQDWLDRVGELQLPVLARVRRLRADLDREGAMGDWARAYARDPLLAAQVFRAVNAGGRTRSGSLASAPVLLGGTAFLDLGSRAPIVEERLPAPAAAAYYQTLRRAHATGVVARHWATLQGYRDVDPVYHGGVFLSLGELLVRTLAPRRAAAVDAALDRPDRGWDGQEEAPLGFPAAALAAALAEAWRLPYPGGPLGPDGALGELVVLAQATLAAAARDPLGPELDDRLFAAARSAGTTIPRVRASLWRGAAAAAREAVIWYPLPGDGRYVALYPRPVRQRPPPPTAQAARHRSPAAAPSPPVSPGPVGAPGRARGEGATPADAPPAAATPDALIRGALRHLARRLGFGRVVFALLSPDRSRLHGRYFDGVPGESGMGAIQIPLEEGAPLPGVLAAGAAVWVGEPRAGGAGGDGIVQGTPLPTPCFLAPVKMRGRPVGLLCADGRGTSKVLDRAAYAGFLQVWQSLEVQLGSLSVLAAPSCAAQAPGASSPPERASPPTD